jgi:hypothetical protein
MSHHNGGPKLANVELVVSRARALKLAEPTITTKALQARLAMTVSISTLDAIIRNERHVDPNYTPPIKARARGNDCGARVRVKRLASIDCPFKCPTCGSAYPEHGKEPFQTFNEAQRCCRKAAAR